MIKRRTYQFWLAGAVSLCCLTTASLTQAQITSRGTLSTKVKTVDNRKFTITGGSRPGEGGNLFHSFDKFSVPEGGSAFFNNDPHVQNIISRVTGGSISNINGLIQANGNANLFLINPKGIIFGRNARLDIGGSFLASTANRLDFADGSSFSAADPQAQPLLSVSAPIGLQFGETGGTIRVIGQPAPFLQVRPGKTLALIGNGVFMKGGSLTAPEGRIELGSVAGTGLVSLNPITEGWVLGYEDVKDFQDITLSEEAVVDTSGAGSGAIQLRGRGITITGYSFVKGDTEGKKSGKSLAVNASEFVKVSDSFLLTWTDSSEKAGDITIETPRLLIRDRGRIGSFTQDSGRAGDITVDASKSVEVRSGSFLYSQTSKNSTGNAGKVKIKTGKLFINGGGQIANSTFGAGEGGTLIVDASESVEVSGQDVKGILRSSGLFAQSLGGQATGNAGILEIDTKRLIVQDGAKISVGAVRDILNPRRFGVSTGQGGELKITASDSVEVTGTGMDETGKVVPSTLLAESQGPGDAGSLAINTGKLIVGDGAEVTVSNTGRGTAGELNVEAGSIGLENKGTLKATTRSGQGGDIRLRAEDLLFLQRNSGISTRAGTSETDGTGGSITIDTDNLVALENSDIDANAFGGPGGRVEITAQGIFGTEAREKRSDTTSDITASSNLGPQFSGTVQINTPDVDPSQELTNLPIEPVNTEIAQDCQAGGGGKGTSRFISSGSGGLPTNPYEPLDSGDILADVQPPSQWRSNPSGAARAATSPKTTRDQIVEAQGWKTNEKGEVVLVAEVPQGPSQRGCRLR